MSTSKLVLSLCQRNDMMEEELLMCDDDALEVEPHDSSDIAEIQCQCEEMKKKIEDLQSRLYKSENKFKRSLFCFENIKDDDEMVKFYTGIPDQATLMAFYEILEDDPKTMRLWVGKKSKDCYGDCEPGRHPKLPLLEQFFLNLVRLSLGLLEQDLANRFGISVSSISCITVTWINLMFHSFIAIERFPPWHVVEKHMPEIFKKEYPNMRLIIDATELQVERPSSLLTQSCTFSTYKNRSTVKVLIEILPSSVILHLYLPHMRGLSLTKSW